MRIFGAILAILYGLLMIFAVIKGKQKSAGSLFIAVGAVFALVYSLLSLIISQSYIVILIAGMLGISVGALLNGIKQKMYIFPIILFVLLPRRHLQQFAVYTKS